MAIDSRITRIGYAHADENGNTIIALAEDLYSIELTMIENMIGGYEIIKREIQSQLSQGGIHNMKLKSTIYLYTNIPFDKYQELKKDCPTYDAI